ncbi:MAG TPA: DinB family protein [Planctomycetota bacterium]|nr:DinB family protein [Planctomycetota bacterium]
MPSDPRIQLLLLALDQAFDHHGWHGPVLWGALRGVSVKQALWRPAAGRNCIHDLVYHCAYWKYGVRRLVSGQIEGKFARSPANFPRRDAPLNEKQWKQDLALLKNEHERLRALVASLDAADLNKRSAKKRWTFLEMIHGVAAHDLYHTGQISLLKRLMKSSK